MYLTFIKYTTFVWACIMGFSTMFYYLIVYSFLIWFLVFLLAFPPFDKLLSLQLFDLVSTLVPRHKELKRRYAFHRGRKVTLNAYWVLRNDFEFGIYEIMFIKCTFVRKIALFHGCYNYCTVKVKACQFLNVGCIQIWWW